MLLIHLQLLDKESKVLSTSYKFLQELQAVLDAQCKH